MGTPVVSMTTASGATARGETVLVESRLSRSASDVAEAGDLRLVRGIHAVMERLPRQRAIHGTGVDVPVAEPGGERAGHGPLADARRSVDRDDEPLRHVGIIARTCIPDAAQSSSSPS